MPTQPSYERAAVLKRVGEKLSAHGDTMTLRQAYEVFKEIESEMALAEGDAELHAMLLDARNELKIAMEARAQELGQTDDWAIAMKGHDARLMLRPLFRAETPQQYIDAYRALSAEQRTALEYWEKKTGFPLPRPEKIAAEVRWVEVRLGTVLRIIPPNPYRLSLYEIFKAIFLAALLATALASTVQSGSWIAALIVLVLFVTVIAIWTRDFISLKRQKVPKEFASPESITARK